MRQYSSYKSSGIEWIGNIPVHWEQCRLKNFCTLKGRIGWKGLRSDEFQTDSYAYLVTGQDFDGSVIPWENCYQIDKERYDEDPYIQLQNGDLLITKDGTIGKVAKVTGLDKPACLNSGIFVLKQKIDVFNQDYLYWVMTSNMLIEFNNYTSSGTTILHLYQNVFENMPLLIPPKDEQIAIASYLNKCCQDIDKIISTQQKRINLLQEIKQSEISHVLTRGINSYAKMKPSGVDWIGNIPEHWERKKLKHHFFDYKAGPFGSSLITSNLLQEGDILVYTPEHIANHSTDLDDNLYLPPQREEEMSQFIVNSGDIIFPIVGTLGRAMLIATDMPKGIINQRLAKFKIKDSLNPSFFLYVFSQSDLYKQYYEANCRGSIIVNLTKELVGDMPIITPPVDEQVSIVQYLDKRCGEINKQIQAVTSQIKMLKEYKQSLIYEVVTGKRKVC